MDHDERREQTRAKVPPQEPSAPGRPEESPYNRAARFDGRGAEHDAEQAYKRSRRDLHRARLETDLSVFRLQLGNRIGNVAYLGWYVALIGKQPDEALEARLEQNLTGGTPVALPEEVIAILQERRERTAKLAPWVERRYGKVTKTELYQRPEGEGEHGKNR